jgi:hypothetical protein
MSPDTLALLLALAPYIVPPLVGVIVYLVKLGFDHLPANVHAMVVQAVQAGVKASEQMASPQLNGPAKKQLATEMIEKILATWHINVPASVISTMIESAVADLNASQPAPVVLPAPVVTAVPAAAPVSTPSAG